MRTCRHLSAPFIEKLEQGPPARRLDSIEVTTRGGSVALCHLRETLVAHHGVAVDAPVVGAAVARSLSLAGGLPDKAITLLDAAAARAAVLRPPTVTLCDVHGGLTYESKIRLKILEDQDCVRYKV